MNQQVRNFVIAATAIALSVLLFLGVQQKSQSPSLSALAESSMPFDIAMANGKPTLVEFYADWCTSCRSMAAEMSDLKNQYSSALNFVMLNVDNRKWIPEMLRYQVDGIPHFIFLDDHANEVAATIGEQPRPIMEGNLVALIDHQPLPYVAGSGVVSRLDTVAPSGAVNDDPRSHGATVQSTEP